MTKSLPRPELLTLKDYRKAARTLLESFQTDQVARYCTRHLENVPELKEKCDILLFEAFVYSHILEGYVVAIKGDDHENNDTFESVALWTGPGSVDVESYKTMIKSGFAKFAWLTGPEGRKRVFGELFKTLHKQCDEILKNEPDAANLWTLVYLGSTPSARGKGNVRVLFDFMFKNYIDPSNGIGYLESSSLSNLPLYRKFGFLPVKDIWLGDKEDPENDFARMDVMVRGPQGSEWKLLDETRERLGYIVPDTPY